MAKCDLLAKKHWFWLKWPLYWLIPRLANESEQFQYPPIRNVWKDRIPNGTDIVLTHGPPKGHLDLGGKGCEWLLHELWRIKPRVVVFGHIHQSRGQEALTWDLIQNGYDFPSFLKVVIMALALGWSWAGSIFGRRRAERTVLVNAAVGDNEVPMKVVYV